MKKYQTIYVLPFLVASFTSATFAANRQLGGRLAPIARMPYQFATFQRRLLSQSAGHSFKPPTRFAYRRKQLADRLWSDRTLWRTRLYSGAWMAIPAGVGLVFFYPKVVATALRSAGGDKPYNWLLLRVVPRFVLNAELRKLKARLKRLGKYHYPTQQAVTKAQQLLQHGADPALCDAALLPAAIRHKNVQAALSFIAAGVLTDRHNSEGRELIYLAMRHNLPEVITAIIKTGVPLNANRLVYLAIEQGLPDTAMELIRAGAPINEAGGMGTPLEMAVECGYTDVVYALVAAGAPFKLFRRCHEVWEKIVISGNMQLARALLIAASPEPELIAPGPRPQNATWAVNLWKHYHPATAEDFKLLLNSAGYCTDPAPAPATASVELNKSGHLGSTCPDWGLFSWLASCSCE